MAKSRSALAKGEAILAARLTKTQNGLVWTTEDLALKSHVTVKTIQNAEAGTRIDLTVLAQIALALEVPLTSLIRRHLVEVYVNLAHESQVSWSDEKQRRLVAGMALLIDTREDFIVVRVQAGSMKVFFSTTPKQSRQMFAAFTDGRLAALGISEIGTTDTPSPPVKPDDFDATEIRRSQIDRGAPKTNRYKGKPPEGDASAT